MNERTNGAAHGAPEDITPEEDPATIDGVVAVVVEGAFQAADVQVHDIAHEPLIRSRPPGRAPRQAGPSGVRS